MLSWICRYVNTDEVWMCTILPAIKPKTHNNINYTIVVLTTSKIVVCNSNLCAMW